VELRRGTDRYHIQEERPLSNEETPLLEWILAHHGLSDASKYLPQIPQLRVVAKCGCGCPTLDFAIGTTRKIGPSDIIADVQGRSPEGVLVGVIVHLRDGEISELEVYDVAGEGRPFTLPKPEALAPRPLPPE
jgi:hypothetical protein